RQLLSHTHTPATLRCVPEGSSSLLISHTAGDARTYTPHTLKHTHTHTHTLRVWVDHRTLPGESVSLSSTHTHTHTHAHTHAHTHTNSRVDQMLQPELPYGHPEIKEKPKTHRSEERRVGKECR